MNLRLWMSLRVECGKTVRTGRVSVTCFLRRANASTLGWPCTLVLVRQLDAGSSGDE